VRLPVDWLREFVAVPEAASDVAARLAACGFAVEGIEGNVIDLEITANRPDCLSVYGLAREAATAFQLPLAPPRNGHELPSSGGAPPLKVSVADPGCGRYALAVADVTVGPSPAWLSDRLVAAGIRPVNNVVDVTNYVMVELGHPLHAFDAATLGGQEIRVRRARSGERLVTLDGEARTLEDTALVIADRERAVAIAGVMGGKATEVSAGTTRIALESAWFQPASVRATSRRLGLKTEASMRFERGADLAQPVASLERTLGLLVEIGAGKPMGGVVDVWPRPVSPRQVALRRERIARLLGVAVPDEDVARILGALGFTLRASPAGWEVEVPSFRVDVAREADLIEEVGRHWGFERIPATFPPLRSAPRPPSADIVRERRVRRLLCGAGLYEAVTWTFIESTAAEAFVTDSSQLVSLANPLSEKLAVLRPSLLPGLVDALVYNRRRDAGTVRLFEIGSTFAPGGEQSAVGWILTGPRADHWSERPEALDAFDALGIAELVAGAFGMPLEVSAAETLPGFVPGRTARLRAGAQDAAGWGVVGEIAPAVLAARGLARAEPVSAGWIDLAGLDVAGLETIGRLAPLPRFPSIVRDLSIVVDERLPAADVRGTIRAHAPAILVSVREFDRYQGRGIPEGRVSLSVRLTFRAPDRTLTDAEVQTAVDGVVAALSRAHAAVLRGGS
jgi:phenylalanyl-tRNA synthetase beta chain